MTLPPTRKPRPARQARPAAPPLPLLETLDQTHRQILHRLDQLALLLGALEAAAVDEPARALATDICQFFDASARPHHAAEEALVFPGLLASGDAALVQHVQRLQQDHGWLEEDWLELSPQLRAVGEGQNWYDLDAFRAATVVFTALYREHIALEESIVYPASRDHPT